MNVIKRKTIAKLYLALGLFVLAGVFRQIDYEIPRCHLPFVLC